MSKRAESIGRLLACAFAFTCLCAPSHAGEFFVTNEKDNSVAVITSSTIEVARKFSVGKRPRGVFVSGSELYVCTSDDDAINVYDTVTGRFLRAIESGADPEQFALSPDGRRLYVANEDDALLSVVDLPSGRLVKKIPVGLEPEGVAASPDGMLVAVTSETTNMVHLVDAAGLNILVNILVDQRPRHAEFSPDGRQLWVSSEIGGTVSVIDVATRAVRHTIAFKIPGLTASSIQPVGITFSAEGDRAFVALGPANRVAAIDTGTFAVTSYILVGQRVWHLALDAAEGRLLTTNGLSNDVTAIDIATLRPIKSVKVGRQPWGIAFRPPAGRATAAR